MSYVPAVSPLNIGDDCQFIPPSIEYWRGGVPPEALTVIDPSIPKLHKGCVWVDVAVIALEG